MTRLAVFASGGGSNFQALLDRKTAGDLHVDFCVLIVNNSNAGAAQRAQRAGIPVEHCAPSHFPTEDAYVAALQENLNRYGVDCIALAGYMKMLPRAIVAAYRHRIFNIHPGLLPAFGGKGLYGANVHRAVLEYGAKVSGITIHFVDEEYDHGPVVLQQAVPVLDNDTVETLAARVLAAEHANFWRAIEAFGRGTLRVEGRRVVGEI